MKLPGNGVGRTNAYHAVHPAILRTPKPLGRLLRSILVITNKVSRAVDFPEQRRAFLWTIERRKWESPRDISYMELRIMAPLDSLRLEGRTMELQRLPCV